MTNRFVDAADALMPAPRGVVNCLSRLTSEPFPGDHIPVPALRVALFAQDAAIKFRCRRAPASGAINLITPSSCCVPAALDH